MNLLDDLKRLLTASRAELATIIAERLPADQRQALLDELARDLTVAERQALVERIVQALPADEQVALLAQIIERLPAPVADRLKAQLAADPKKARGLLVAFLLWLLGIWAAKVGEIPLEEAWAWLRDQLFSADAAPALPSIPPAPLMTPAPVVTPTLPPPASASPPAVEPVRPPAPERGDLYDLVTIPAGPFEMGSAKGEPDAYEGEYSAATGNQRHRVTLSEYRIGRYPVTNAEYRRYVRAKRVAPPGHWRDGDIPPGLESHPVVYVSWGDARAYCAWLTGVWRGEGRIGRGEVVRLPTEAEWEKAARWDQPHSRSRVYPWGDKWDAARCNHSGSTTPVGRYPDGASPYGCLDMAGNVWEWTSSKHQPYPYRPDDGREDPNGSEARVARGGSWSSDQRLARCAFRFYNVPGVRGSFIGFRVVVSPGSLGLTP